MRACANVSCSELGQRFTHFQRKMKRKRPRSVKGNATNNNLKKLKQDGNEDSKVAKPEKCSICRQYTSEITLYSGHLNKSSEEFIALTDESLLLFTGNEENIHEGDELPSHKITHFSIYDDNGHLCPFDTGLIEKNVLLHVSGYIKPIYEEDASPNNGIAAHDMGPINEWYIGGFDGGEKAIVGIVTPYAQYILMEPSLDYTPFVTLLKRKILLVKLVIEYLLDHSWEDPTYEDLLSQIESEGNGEFSEDFLLQHAQFVCDQIYSYDQAGSNEDKPLITVPCVRTLVGLSGVTFRKRKKIRRLDAKSGVPKKPVFSKATTTALVSSIFENFFPDQIEMKYKKGPKKKRCGVCDACQAPDCGKCTNCKDMIKFGGTGRSKQACTMRRCPNMAVEDAELSENETETEDVKENVKRKSISSKRSVNKVEWLGEAVSEAKGRKFYDRARVGNMEIKRGDYVMLNAENPDEPLSIAKIQYMYERFPQGPTVHAFLFYRGSDTILGETADPQDLFAVNICEDCPLGSVVRKAEVTIKSAPDDWFDLGGTEMLPPLEDDGHIFFVSKQYNITTATFTDYKGEKDVDGVDSCSNCLLMNEKKKFETAVYVNEAVQWRGETYHAGSCVFLEPTSYTRSVRSYASSDSMKSVDEIKYPEYYRKTVDVKGSNHDTPEPFRIAQIEDVSEKGGNISLKVRVFYRPEDTKSGAFLSQQSDVNLVYWTTEVTTLPFDKVVGKCYILYCDVLESPEYWYEKGPYRFYFSRSYCPVTYQYGEVPDYAKKIGWFGKGKGKGKGKSKSSQIDKDPDVPPVWEQIEEPLRCMDIFAGCGGLSKGLHQAGIAETKWAIEKETPAAQAFKLNNQACKVFTNDCNDILEQVISGQGASKGLPAKGEVELLVGGPPCQGFSGMNRFNAGQYSLFKNSLVVSYLSYCDYYRPKYFVLENVRNFVSFKRSMVLKLALRCLLAIGYQVTFGVLQAGHYGVPQTRRRLILLAAAPGFTLPKLPEPQHVFSKRGCHLSFALDGVKFTNGCLWTESAPYRTVCVRDAIYDLPEIKNGWNQTEMPYDGDPISCFQKKMRSRDSSKLLVDHVCKEMAPIVEARISYIPIIPGSDWRDLPNIAVKLNDGTTTSVLRYPYPNKKQKNSEPNRGVCLCALGAGCDPSDRQVNTLIPWCLPHTADRHNHWSGLYGRLEWDGYFGTTITNPEPMGKQGRVLHPEQNRVVSVRECARSQGFPDYFKFHGTVMDKHRQVGNAVPPPLGRAIGLEIKKALVKTKSANV